MFVTFEGHDGVGKSTTVRLVDELLRSRGIDTVVTRTPGGTPEGKIMRELLVNSDYFITNRARPFLFLADMIQVAEHIIVPALTDGKTVLCDRWLDSTIVYQVMAPGVWAEIEQGWLAGVIRCMLPNPDLTLVIDAPVSEASQRIKVRGEALSHFEMVDGAVINKRRKLFLGLRDRCPNRNIQLVSSYQRKPEQVAEEILSIILEERNETTVAAG